MKWTPQQQQVIDLRHKNILVSAAAGSGKTAVLVERILTMITSEKQPKDIDSLLIVTFTKAAAGEMRERIRSAIEKRLETEPDNEHLQKQSTLIYNAQINTIDGFCSYIIKNYFHMIDLDPGYRTANDGELRLMKRDVMEEVLEEAYAQGSQEFHTLVESYATGKNDENIGTLVLQLYEYSMSYPWPREWLEECKSHYQISTKEQLQKAPWMEGLMEETRKVLEDTKVTAEELMSLCDEEDGPYMYRPALESDLELLEGLLYQKTYDDMVKKMAGIKYARLSSKRDESVSEIGKNQVKEGRQEIKDTLKEMSSSYFSLPSQEVLDSIVHSRVPVCALIDLAIAFMDAFQEKKKEKNLIDFADMEHYALEILTKREDGKTTRSSAALELSKQFSDIFIDEYQDSNLVQETILNAISRMSDGEYNLFMVGDVKQSIYRFRLARPELFMEKFHGYAHGKNPNAQRIDLHENFRSRPQVLEGANYIFRQIMGEDLGKVEYDKGAALYPGASFPSGNKESFADTEVLIVEKDGIGMEDEKGGQAARELEALEVAARIREIVGKEQVLDKATGEYRMATYGDIVVLLRTMSGWSETFTQVFLSQGIPAYSTTQTGYFSALEVVTVLNYLHILDNPRQDIPLGAVLRSPIVGCTAQELGEIRAIQKNGDLYGCLMGYKMKKEESFLGEKIKGFFRQYEKLRKMISYTPIHELIHKILQETGYENFAAAMPGGEQRSANLHMLVEKAMEFEQTSYRGLFNFIRYIENLQKYNVDFGEVNLSGDGNQVVQIMSIHKSKGLEFPIVFVSGLGKSFNRQDVNAPIVIHPELGIGADCIYPQERFKFPTVMKEVIRHEIKVENLGEELRVLYVAMTRAKEKLILTGALGKVRDVVGRYHRFASRREERLPYNLRESASSYFGWILPALARHKAFVEIYQDYHLSWDGLNPLFLSSPPMKVKIIHPMELLAGQIEMQSGMMTNQDRLLNWDGEKIYNEEFHKQIQERFSFSYPYGNRKDIPVKVTVSEVKRQKYAEEEADSYEVYFEPDVIPLIPDFVEKKKETYTGAMRGTAYHRVMECLDYTQLDTIEQVEMQKRELLDKGKIDADTAETVETEDILGFANTSLGKRMARAQQAGLLKREQPFVIAQPAGDIQPAWGNEESVLVQGIIDAYFEEEDGLVVVDYKTDRIEDPKELVDHYRIQLDYYARALERLTGKRVKEKVIYSFTLGTEVPMDFSASL